MGYYGGYYGMYFDPTYLLVIIGAVLCLLAQLRVSTTFGKYNRVMSRSWSFPAFMMCGWSISAEN